MSDSIVEIANYCFNLFDAADFKSASGVVDVFYGDQTVIPRTPTICVEPSLKGRELNGVPRRTLVDMEIYVMIYHGKLQNVQTNRREADQIAEAAETALHSDPTCGGLVISSLVSRLESGFSVKENSLFRVTRLTFTTRSQVQLPMAGV